MKSTIPETPVQSPENEAIDTATIGIASQSSFLRMPNGAILFNGHPIPACDASHPCYVYFRVVSPKEVR